VSEATEKLVVTAAVTLAAASILTADYLKTPFDALFNRFGPAYDVPPDLLRAIARKESRFRPTAVYDQNDPGEGRDVGLMQINEVTARRMGRDVDRLKEPAYAVETACLYLRAVRRELGASFSIFTWIAAYNAGSPAIKRRGIFNLEYTAEVFWHFSLYQLATLARGGK